MTNSRPTSFATLTGCIVLAEASSTAPVVSASGRFADTSVLTAALRAGDEAAFRWLHEHWHARLMRYCLVVASGDFTRAAEIAQATYLRVIRHIRMLPDEEALWAWLARAARSSASDLNRTGGRYLNALARFGEWLGGRPGGADDSTAETEATLFAALEAALLHLSPEERELIDDRYFQRTPLAATAARLNTTERAIEGRLARLRARLRDIIAAELSRQEPP